MRTEELDFELPEHLIASEPAARRDAARLLVTHEPAGVDARPRDRHVYALPGLLRAGDVLVLNDTRVLPARFFGERAATGGRVEGLFVELDAWGRWIVLLESRGRLQPGESIALDAEHALVLVERRADAAWVAERRGPLDVEALLDRVGLTPLPPYIRRARGARTDDEAERDAADRERYQTVYAGEAGAVAAPTAGLHFTPGLLDELAAAGVQIARLTLHVGLGTFAPVRTDELAEHPMHRERYSVPAATLEALRRARAEGRRIIPVGTTSVRALESLPVELPTATYRGSTDLLIEPGFAFRFTDGLLTNFHLPRSTLLALVAARVGLDRLRSLYRHAIAAGYRFYSYGDAMLILPRDRATD